MSIIEKLRSGLASLRGGVAERPGKNAAPQRRHDGFFSFANTGEVIRAEALLKEAGFPVRVMGPPPSLRTGCDMVIVFPLARAYAAAALLEQEGLAPLRMVPAGEALLSPVSLYMVKDYGQWLMVRAANMKITAEKASGRIVNVSGGGCPDVPYLAALLVGNTVDAAPQLKKQGQTLCSYALDLALAELARLLAKGQTP